MIEMKKLEQLRNTYHRGEVNFYNALVVIALLIVAGMAFMALTGTGPIGADQEGASCLVSGRTITTNYEAWYLDGSSDWTKTNLAALYETYATGARSYTQSGMTSASGAAANSTNPLVCEGEYHTIYGDGSTYGHVRTGDYVVEKDTIYAGGVDGVEIPYYADPTVKFANESESGQSVCNIFWSTSDQGYGGSDDTCIITVKSPSSGKSYGNGGYAICGIYNSTTVDWLDFGGAATTVDHIDSNVTGLIMSKDKIYCETFAGNELKSTEAQTRASFEHNFEIKATASNLAGNTTGVGIDIIIIDMEYEVVDGEFDSYEGKGWSKKTNKNTGVGRTDYRINDAIMMYT